MDLCAKGIEFDSFYDFAIGVWNCSDSVVFCVFHIISKGLQFVRSGGS
jgi:hypothetical protein